MYRPRFGSRFRSRIHARVAPSLAAVGLLLVAAPAAAQDDAPSPPPAASAAVATPVAPVAPGAAVPEPKVPSLSISLERAGGLGYAKASESKEDAGVSVTAFGVGGVTPNPFAIPRVGVDAILPSNLTLGGAVGFSRVSGSLSEKSKSTDIGSVFLYTVTPRVGYRIALTDKIDLTPRAGLTFAGGSASPAEGDNSASIFAIAIGADAPLAFRLTDSFNVLVGAALDYTVSATVSTDTQNTTVVSGPNGTTTSSSTRTDDVKGSLFSMQAWLGLGGYL
jgi:hypothetical protein